MYTAGEPEGIIKDYITWILSADAQEIVKELGFVPILTNPQISNTSGGTP
jgi:phosphate transport system substrate-binding protein